MRAVQVQVQAQARVQARVRVRGGRGGGFGCGRGGVVRARSGMASGSSGVAVGEAGQEEDWLVQYVVLRRDLAGSLGWPLGSVVAQGAHAAVAACAQFADDPDTQAYVGPENVSHMRKVCLGVKGEAQLLNLSAKLTDAGVAHRLWRELPEDFPTALATKPAPKSTVAAHFKKVSLLQ